MKKKSLLALLIALLMCFAMASAQAEAEFTAPGFYSVVTVEGTDPQEMLDGFALREMYGMRGVATWGVTARRTLSEPMKLLYDALKEEIEKVAIGSRSSTVFTFSAEEMKEMGFNTIFEYTDGAGFYAQVDIFLAQVSDAEIGKLLNALLLDCPYDMYWYDQTSGMSTGSGDINGSNHVGRVEGLTFTMPVSAVFRGENANTVAAKWGTAAVAAGEKAADIIEAAADLPDHEKLYYYAEQIMNLVDYNNNAVTGDMNNYYANVDANPWQLIYVFDGDPSTNVVCEGYSKAFQYLCDMTEFDNEDVRCITVTGWLAGGTGAGGHMWNVVRMDDGLNYIMDVTNSELGTAGELGELMLGGSPDQMAANEDWGIGYEFATDPVTTFQYAKTVPYDEADLLLADSLYVPKYYVTFEPNGATGTMDKQGVEQGQMMTLNGHTFTAPVGGIFKGWNTKADGTGTQYADGANITPAGNMTLFAQWKMAQASLTSGGEVTIYEDLSDAVYDAKDGDTITLLQYVNLGTYVLDVEKDITITGKSLAGDDHVIIVRDANLTLKDITIVSNGDDAGIALMDSAAVTLYDDVTFVPGSAKERQDILMVAEDARIIVAENRTSPVYLGSNVIGCVVAVPAEGVTLSTEDFIYPEKYNSLFVKEEDGSIGLYYDLSKATMEIDYDSIDDWNTFFKYSGSKITPPVTVAHSPNTDKNYVNYLEEGYGFTLTYENNINSGEETAKAIATGVGDYRGTKEVAFSISPAYTTDVGLFGSVPEATKSMPVVPGTEYVAAQVAWEPAPALVGDGNYVADFATEYTATIHYQPVENYFIDFGNLELEEKGYRLVEIYEDGSMDVEIKFPATRNRALNSLASLENRYEATEYCATEADVLKYMPTQLMGEAETLSGDLEDVTLPISWVIHDFNPYPKGEMSLSWDVDADALAKYTVLEDVVTDGSCLVKNGPGVDPSVSVTPLTIVFDNQELPIKVDVSQCFTVHDSNGAVSYSLAYDTDCATLDGNILSFTQPGSAEIFMRVEADGKYYERVSLANITLEKGVPDVEVPTGMTGPYGFTLGDVDFSDSGWSWVSAVETMLWDEGVEQFFYAIYTPEDTTWWSTVVKQVGVTPVRTALTVSGTGEAKGVYGDSLIDLVVTGPDVTNINGQFVPGEWSFVANVDDLPVGVHTYQAVFTPYDDLYQPLEAQDITVTIGPKDVVGIIELEKNSYPYTGSAIEPAVKVYVDDVLVDPSEYTVLYSNNVDIGVGMINLEDVEGGNYVISGLRGFLIEEAETEITDVTIENQECTYGDVITVKAKPQIKVMASRTNPQSNQMAMFNQNGVQLCDAVDPDETGVYTMTIDTTEKVLEIGKNDIELYYVSDGSKGDAYKFITVTLSAREMTVESAEAESRVYAPGNKNVDVTAVLLGNVVALDNVFVVVDESITGTLESDQAGTYTTVTLPELELDGTDLEWYTFIASDTAPTEVEILPMELLDVLLPADTQLLEYAPDAEAAQAQLPSSVIYLDENGLEWWFDISWECQDFDPAPVAGNAFSWKVDDPELQNFDVSDDVPTSGSITVTNADGLPVVNTGSNKTFTYNGSNASVDVAALFTLDENAGEASYEIASGDCATLDGTTLTFTKAGVVKINLKTAANGQYLASTAVATVKMNKGTMTPEVPTGMTGVVGQTLADVAFAEANWAWADDTTALTAAGEKSFPAIYTPDNTDLWEQATGTVTLTVKPADLTVSGTGTASGIYTMRLKDMLISGLTVKDPSGNEVPGMWAFTEGTTVPDAGVSTWKAAFTPDSAANYNAAAAQDVTVTVQAKPVVATVKLEYDTHAYTGAALEPAVTAYDGETLIPADEYTVEYENNLNAGTATVTLTDAEGGNYQLTGSTNFAITLGETDLSNLKADKEIYTYGEKITVTAQPVVKVGPVMAMRIEPKANQMALYLGDTQISDAVDADLSGVYTMTVDTADKELLIGENTLTARYVSDGNQADAFGTVTVTLNRAKLTITSATATSRDYAAGDMQVDVTAVTLDGILGADEVSVGGLPVKGLLSSDAAGDYTTVTLPANLSLTGADAEWYILESGDAATQVTISKKPLSSVTVPEDQPLDAYYTDPDDVAEKLPQTIPYMDEDGNEVEAPITWSCDDFDTTPGAENTFHWTIDPEVLKNHAPAEGVDTEGDITVTNPTALPVTITAKDATITYDGSTYDVSALFTVDENAGAKTYAVVSGDATLSGTTLTILKAGQIKISLSTAANDPYAAAEATATLTVQKGNPMVSGPIGLTATYGQTLADVALPTAATGVWSWVDATASVGDAGVNQHKALFTPNDTDLWNTLTQDVDVTVSKATVGFDASIKVFRGEEETSTFTYGEAATVKAEIKPVASSVMAARVAPGANQMALYLGEKQVSDAADPVDGVYTLTVDTKAKELSIGTNKLKLKYVGTANVTDAEAEVSITVNPKPLTATAATAADRAYIPGSKLVTITGVTLEGALSGDNVKADLTGLKGAVASEDAGEYEEVSLIGLKLTGADAAYYTVADATVPTKVTITKATPETSTGADPEPAPAKPYEPGITLEEAAPSLPEGTFDVPGQLSWDVPADTVIEPGKSYPWTFQPDDEDNYQPVKGESVIYPLGEKPVITSPTAPQSSKVVEGGSATFTVTAEDAETYQWQVDRGLGDGFEDIEGANGSGYTTGALTPAESGYRFRCVVMNDYGTAVSPEFTVNVTEKPNIPVTGDKTNLVLLFALALMSLTAMSFMAFRRKEN